MTDVEKISFERLDVENYPTWSIRMKYALVNKGLWKAVSAEVEVDVDVDQKAIALIGLFVKDHHLATLEECKSAKEAWQRLERVYQSKSNARKLQLKRELNQLKKESGEPLTKFVARAKALRDQLCAAGLDVKSEEVTWAVLAGLPKEFDVVVTVLQTAEELQDLDVILAKLLAVESRAGTSGENEKALYVPAARTQDRREHGHAQGGRGSGRGQGRAQGGRGQRKFNGACYNCGITGHKSADCRKPKKDSQAGGSRESGFLGREVALMAGPALSRSDWVLDSGASRHMTNDADILTEVKPVTDRVSFTGIMGDQCKAETVGTVNLYGVSGSRPGDVLVVRNVAYVPGAVANLLSIPICVRNGVKFEFEEEKCYLVVKGEVVAVAMLKAGVYVLNVGEVQAPLGATEIALAATAPESPELWHRRFGHLGYENLAKMQSADMVTGIGVPAEKFKSANGDICEPCVQAKQHRHPHPVSSSDSRRVLELIHMDVCGPFAETSLGGAKYFATYLDDYSKLSVVRPIEFKSDVAAVTMDVISMLEKQSGRSVMIVRTDNGTEYVNRELTEYFAKKGILHQKSVRYVPEQNGSAERLNRTLLERVRAMLSDSGLPKSLWAEAVVTACFIRNRSPVSTRDKTPWELFFGKKPDVSAMRVYGARAYVHVPKQLRGKLESHSEMGYLVGYEPNAKGYRIYLDSGKMRVAVHAVFQERAPAGQKDEVVND